MTLRRIEAGAVGLLLEWNEETGMVALALGGDRDVAYERLEALQGFLLRETGVVWRDDELSERVRPVCGVTGRALVWRATFSPPGGAGYVGRAVMAALGVEE